MVMEYRRRSRRSAAHRVRYWRQRILSELEGNVRHNNEAVSMVGPPGFVLVAKRQVTISDTVYPVGAVVPIEALAVVGNFQALLDGRFLAWVAASNKPRSQPRALPPAPPAPKRPEIEIIAGSDALDSWRKTKSAMAEKLGGNASLAEDILLGDPRCRALYLDAVRVGCKAEAQRRGTWSVSPSEVAGL